jgi:hypothetical protein
MRAVNIFIAVMAAYQVLAGPGTLPRFRVIGDTAITYPFESVPYWSGNAVVAISDNRTAAPVVRVFGEDGAPIAAIAIRIPGFTLVEVRRAAHGITGVTAICGAARNDNGGVTGFLAVSSGGSEVDRLIRTEPYSPTAVAVAPDGTIWMKGVEYVPVQRVPNKTNTGIIRHFDAEGKQIGSYLPQSGLTIHDMFGGVDYLAANVKRVGWYRGSLATTYVEVVGGQIEKYPAVPPKASANGEATAGQVSEVTRLAITDDDQVFVTRTVNGRNPELFVLDRVTKLWNFVPTPEGGGPPEATSWLMGGSGATLVFQTTEQSNRLRRFEVLSK